MPIAHKGLDGGSIVGTQASLIELQCFFLLLLRRVGHIALRRFLHSKDIAHQTSLDKDLLERRSAFLVVKAIDCENLLAVILCKSQGCLYFLELILEFALVQQHEHI